MILHITYGLPVLLSATCGTNMKNAVKKCVWICNEVDKIEFNENSFINCYTCL